MKYLTNQIINGLDNEFKHSTDKIKLAIEWLSSVEEIVFLRKQFDKKK